MASVQDNLSRSRRGVSGGQHLQRPDAQGKRVQVLEREVFEVAVDIRVGSPSYGQWEAFVLSAANRRQLWVPPGFAQGFCMTSERALFAYKCSALYNPAAEATVAWNDPALAIPWPVEAPELSARDAAAARLAEFVRERLPRYGAEDQSPLRS